jgi:hypothetical protein
MTEPNFFVVGAPKAGTTSLYAYLDQHPQVYMSPLKEPYFFASEMRVANFSAEERPRLERDGRVLAEYLRGDMREKRFGGLVSDWDDYLKLFRAATTETAIGEASPHYLWSESAARNIAARIPHARILISLRNPIDRAFSDYLHVITDRPVKRTFREHIDASLNCHDQRIGLSWPFLEYGQYTRQIQRYFETFPRSQIHICFYDDLQRSPRHLMAQMFEFLGVDPGFTVDMSRRHNEPRVPKYARATHALRKLGVWPLLRQLAPHALRSRLKSHVFRSRASLAPEPGDREFLADYYRDEVNRLSELLGRDLTHWVQR